MRHFSLLGLEASCAHPELTPNYLENLCRLWLTELPSRKVYADAAAYEHPEILELKAKIEANGNETAVTVREGLFVTAFGGQFLTACVIEPNKR